MGIACPEMGFGVECSGENSHFLFRNGGFLAERTIGSMRDKYHPVLDNCRCRDCCSTRRHQTNRYELLPCFPHHVL
jgi:hypothetical protein